MNNNIQDWKEFLQLPFTQNSIDEFVKKIEANIESGYSDGMDDYAIAWFLAKLSKAVIDSEVIKKSVLQEQARYSKLETCTHKGLRIERMSVTRYEYKGKGFEALDKIMESIKSIQKTAQDLSKNISTKGTIVHPETGEELEILPAKKLVNETPKLSFTK